MLLAPSTALYQDGRGSEPMIDVGRMTLADPLNMALSPAAHAFGVLLAQTGLSVRSRPKAYHLGKRLPTPPPLARLSANDQSTGGRYGVAEGRSAPRGR